MRESISMCSSFQMPRSWGEIRPRASTAAASVKISAAPPTARLPKCTKCQSFAKPSSDEYWHIGETTSRFFSVISRILYGSNNIKNLIRFAGVEIDELAVDAVGCAARQKRQNPRHLVGRCSGHEIGGFEIAAGGVGCDGSENDCVRDDSFVFVLASDCLHQRIDAGFGCAEESEAWLRVPRAPRRYR